MRIVVCDDENAPRDDWVEAIKALNPRSAVDQIGRDESGELTKLVGRRFALRSGEDVDWTAGLIDQADVLVVDYDLTLISKDARHTGEEVARLARMFSTCGYVIVMNQYPGVGFDLTLKGHLESYADLNIDAELIETPALWKGKDFGGFSPWHWSDLIEITASRKVIAERMLEGEAFEASVFDFIGMPSSAQARLSDTASGFVDTAGKDAGPIETTTIREFLASLSEHKDLEHLRVHKPIFAARTAVARLAKWLSRVVLGGQDVLVDVPHLLARMPYLRNPNLEVPKTIDDWNRLVDRGAEAVHEEVLSQAFWAGGRDWIGKDAFWWSELASMDLVDDLRDAYDFEEVPDMVFAEDTSRFIEAEGATEFRAGFHNIYDRRYIERPVGSIIYAPRKRLTFAV